MHMHRKRQRCRAAMAPELAHHVAELGVRCAAAAELSGHRGAEHAAFFELTMVVEWERIIRVVGRGAGGEAWPELTRHREPVNWQRVRRDEIMCGEGAGHA